MATDPGMWGDDERHDGGYHYGPDGVNSSSTQGQFLKINKQKQKESNQKQRKQYSGKIVKHNGRN